MYLLNFMHETHIYDSAINFQVSHTICVWKKRTAENFTYLIYAYKITILALNRIAACCYFFIFKTMITRNILRFCLTKVLI